MSRDMTKYSKHTGYPRERKRYLALARIRDGKSFTEAAAAIMMRLRTLMNWIKRFREIWIDGLLSKDRNEVGI